MSEANRASFPSRTRHDHIIILARSLDDEALSQCDRAFFMEQIEEQRKFDLVNMEKAQDERSE
jgi:hypothetical protein